MQVKLTKSEIERAWATAKKLTAKGTPPRGTSAGTILWDTETKGFCVRVSPSNPPMFWTWKRGPAGRVRATIGPFGELWTVELASKQAAQDVADILSGRDPSKRGPAVPGKGRRPWAEVEAAEAQEVETSGPDVASLCDRYSSEWAEVHKKPREAVEDARRIRKHINPALGHLLIAKVTRAHITELLHAMRETPIAANRTRSLLHKMFNLAEEWGLRPEGTSNPVSGTPRYKEEQRKRFLTEAEKKRLGNAIRDLLAEKKLTEPVARAIRLYLLAGFRRDELLTARFDAVDTKRKTITLADGKTGGRVVHLGPEALEIIRAADDGTSPFIIPGRGPRSRQRKGSNVVTLPGTEAPTWPRNTVQKSWARVRKRARLGDVRLHDLRHSHASDLIAAGFSLKHVAAQLGHTTTRMSERYAHVSDEGVRAAVAAAEKLSAAILPTEMKKPRSRRRSSRASA